MNRFELWFHASILIFCNAATRAHMHTHNAQIRQEEVRQTQEVYIMMRRSGFVAGVNAEYVDIA